MTDLKQFQIHFEEDPGIKEVHDIARDAYNKTGKLAHNYNHVMWDAVKALQIAETIEDVNYSILLPMVFLHDIGVTMGPYEKHAETGAKMARGGLPDVMFGPKEIEAIAKGIEEHDTQTQTFLESQILYDADTLNKAGAHGIQQCHLVGQEFGLSLDDMAQRFVQRYEQIVGKGFYTDKAREINQEMGNGIVGGIQQTQQYWQMVSQFLNTPKE